MEVDEESDKKSDIKPYAHARLKDEFIEGEKCQNLMGWLINSICV